MEVESFRFLRKRHVRLSLITLCLASLIVYLIPGDPSPLVTTGTRWVYDYRESSLSMDNLVSVYEAVWRYLVVDSFNDIAHVEINGSSKLGYRSQDGSWVEVDGRGSSSFVVNVRTRLFDYGHFSSWWVPVNLRLGDAVLVWNLNLRVVGLTWRIVEGRLLECLILAGSAPSETYTFYYERTTGFFVHFSVRRTYGYAETTIERSLRNTSLAWPAVAILRPFLVPTTLAGLALLLAPSLILIDERSAIVW